MAVAIYSERSEESEAALFLQHFRIVLVFSSLYGHKSTQAAYYLPLF